MPCMSGIPVHVCTVCVTLFPLSHPSVSALAWPVCTVTQRQLLQLLQSQTWPQAQHSPSWQRLLSVLILHICLHVVFAEHCHVFHPLFLGTNRRLCGALAFLRRLFQQPFISPSLSKERHLFRCSLLSFSHSCCLNSHIVFSECPSFEPRLNQAHPGLFWICWPQLWGTKSQSDYWKYQIISIVVRVFFR